MAELVRLTRPKILRQVGEASVQKARNYLRKQVWRDLRAQGDSIKGRCQGNAPSPYRVSVTFDGDEIAGADCSCPVGDGGHCKHVAALLLYYREHPDNFVEVEELDARLERRSKGELVALIRRMVRRVPELELLLDVPLPGYTDPARAADPEPYRRQVESVFERAESHDTSASDMAHELHDIVATGDEFRAAGGVAAGGAVYQAVAEEVLAQFENFDDEDGSLIGVVSDCAAGLCGCLEATPADAPHRAALIRTLVDLYVADEAHGGMGMSDSVPDALLHQTTPAEQHQIAGRLREHLPVGNGWSDEYQRRAIGSLLQELEAGEVDDETIRQFRRCREAAEREIERRTRDGYKAACEHLKEMRDLSRRLDQNGSWDDYLAGLRRRFGSLRALQDEMDRAGLTTAISR